jgi:branched-chain amino acid transport system permease protein
MIWRKELLTFMVLGIIFILLALLAPISGYDYYLIGLMTSACLWVIYVVSWDLLAGYTGMLNFGQLLFAGVAAYTVALFELHYPIPRPLMMLAGLIAGISSSLLISLSSLRVRSAYFALVSFAMLLVFSRITLTFIKIFGGDYGLSIPRVYSRESLYFTALILMVVTMVTMRLVVRSRIGVALQCIREDEETTRAVGIHVSRYKIIVCLISSFFTSLAGICGFYYMGHVGPEMFGMMGSFNVVFMGVIGGTGTILGAALGGGVLAVVLEYMRPVAEFRNLLYALLLAIMVMAAPRGVWGGIASFWNKKRGTKKGVQENPA